MDSMINVDIGKSNVLKTEEVGGYEKEEDTSTKKSYTKLSTKRRREEDSSSDTDTSLSHKSDSVEDTKEILEYLMVLIKEMFNTIIHLETSYSQVKSDTNHDDG